LCHQRDLGLLDPAPSFKFVNNTFQICQHDLDILDPTYRVAQKYKDPKDIVVSRGFLTEIITQRCIISPETNLFIVNTLDYSLDMNMKLEI
jgi:hypothetical protein